MTQRMTTMHIELSVGDSISVGGAFVTLWEKSGRRARLKVSAPEQMPIKRHRREHFTTCAQECAPSQETEHTHGKHPV